jgi:hypothetical protein
MVGALAVCEERGSFFVCNQGAESKPAVACEANGRRRYIGGTYIILTRMLPATSFAGIRILKKELTLFQQWHV